MGFSRDSLYSFNELFGEAALALNSWLNKQRVRRLDDLLMMELCNGTYAEAKNPNITFI